MSLLDERKKECVKLLKTQTRDGYGGNNTVYTQSEVTFNAAIVLNTDNNKPIADKDTLVNTYFVFTDKNTGLCFNDYIQRKQDGKCFRIITDSIDRHTPNSAYLNIEKVEAEEVNIKVVAENVTK